MSCSNRGVCTDLVAAFKCTCDTPEEWTGDLCDIEYEGLISFVAPSSAVTHITKSFAHFREVMHWGSLSLEFRTTAENGVLAFGPDAKDGGTGTSVGPRSVAIELVAGVVVFNTQGGVYAVTVPGASRAKVNDGAWHRLVLKETVADQGAVVSSV